MEKRNRKKYRSVPVKWIAAGTVAAVLAVIVLLLLLGRGNGKTSVPPVQSVGEAIDLLSSRAEDLGYENALSELTELHSTTVSGDSYYRLQQNYQGIPVFGRTVVYAADEKGEHLAVTQNVQDISGGLNLNPTVTLEEVQGQLLTYLAETYPDSPWASGGEVLPEVQLDSESLCIYNLDGTDHLAYELYVEGLCLLADAHTGQVLHAYPMIRSATATFGFSDDVLEVPQLPTGEYVLKDEEYGIYVYSAEGKTYWTPDPFSLDVDVLKQVRSENAQFGETGTLFEQDDTVDFISMIHAKESLYCVRGVSGYFTDLMNGPQVEKMLLVYDDYITLKYRGDNAGGGILSAKTLLGTPLFDSDDPNEKVAVLILGTQHSDIPENSLDVIAHEYTHIVTARTVNWTDGSKQNKALDEAFSDIFGELVQADIEKRDPDWNHGGHRYLDDPYKNNYPVKIGDTYPSDTDFAHGASTIISHTAYLMWNGFDGTASQKLSTEELAQLWYRTMLMLPSDADFADCRYAVEMAAEAMGLSDSQKRCIQQAFDNAGIAKMSEDPNVDFQVADVFTVNIWEPDNTRCEDCDVTVRKAVEVYGPVLPMDAPIRWNSSNSEQCHLKLDPGYYTLTVQVHGEPGETKKYTIQVMPDDSGEKEIDIHTNIGRAMLDVQIRGKEGGKEVSLPDASIEIYRDNPNQLVYMGNGAERRFYLRPDNYTVVVTAPGYQPEQMSFRMQDNSIRYSHSFLLEPVAQDSSGDLPATPEPITGGVPYEVLSWEASYTGQADGTEFTNRYIYEYIVLQGDDPAYEAINRDLYRLAQEQWNKILDGPLQYLHQDRGEVCKDYEEYIAARVTHNGNGIISILMGPDQAVTYSLYNGARLGLHILSGDHQVEYLKTIQKTVATNNASELGLSDFGFAVMDSEIVILGTAFPGGSLFAPYSRMIHTGLYVSTEYTERLKGTLRATGGTGSASYEILELDRSYLRRGRPDCLQSKIHVCQYPVASGAAAAGQISQEAYDLARQFIDAFPDELTNTSNRYEFDWECNRYSDDERISSGYEGVQYNNNGILCYVMDWKVELKHYRDGQKFIGAERYDGLYGTTYDLQTGAHLTLQQVTGMDEKTQQLMLRDAYGRVYNYYYLNSHRMSYDPAGFSLEDPAFFIDRDGQIMLHFSVTEQFEADYLADLPKTAHTFVVTLPTELYVLGS